MMHNAIQFILRWARTRIYCLSTVLGCNGIHHFNLEKNGKKSKMRAKIKNAVLKNLHVLFKTAIRVFGEDLDGDF